MPSTITIGASSAASTYSGGAPSAASLQAQLQRYQKQLSDCVNCASAKTPQGKADIQQISARISQVKQRIEQTETTQSNPPTTQPRAQTVAASTPTGFGGLINVFA